MCSLESNVESEGTDDSSDQSSRTSTPLEDEEPRKRVKPPDSKKFEQDVEHLSSRIREKEAVLQSLSRPPSRTRSGSNSTTHAWKDRETLLADLRGLKAEKEKDIEVRKKIDLELKGLTSLVQQKNDACGKAQAGLKYKTEAKTDESIRRLEHQLRVQKLKLRDEKRIVTEIDALRRSKKLIHEFIALKQLLDELRDKQRALRTQRDSCTKRINGFKAKEDEIKNVLDEQKSKADEIRSIQRETESDRMALKKEIDELYKSKRELVATFNKERKEYYNIIREAKQHMWQKRKEEAHRLAEEKRRELLKERKARSPSPQPYEKELTTCATLVEYMERLSTTHQPDRPTTPGETLSSPEPSSIDTVEGAGLSDGVFLRRKTDDDETPAGRGRRMSRRGSKKNRKSLGKETLKKIVHHPHVVEQFMFINVVPPSTAADIPKVLGELQAKTELYTSAVADVTNRQVPSAIVSVESSTASSISSEDFPSLPSLPSSDSAESQRSSNTDSWRNDWAQNGSFGIVKENSDHDNLSTNSEEKVTSESELPQEEVDVRSETGENELPTSLENQNTISELEANSDQTNEDPVNKLLSSENYPVILDTGKSSLTVVNGIDDGVQAMNGELSNNGSELKLQGVINGPVSTELSNNAGEVGHASDINGETHLDHKDALSISPERTSKTSDILSNEQRHKEPTNLQKLTEVNDHVNVKSFQDSDGHVIGYNSIPDGEKCPA